MVFPIDVPEVRQFCESSPNAVLILKPNGELVWMNRAAREFFDETDVKPGLPFERCLASETGKFQKFLEHAATNGTPVPGIVKVRRRDGGTDQVRCHGSLLRPSQQPSTGWVVLHCQRDTAASRDFDEINLRLQRLSYELRRRKFLEDMLREALENAEEANTAKTNFLAGMSHELRTPLNAILGFSESMLEGTYGPVENPRYAEYVGAIHQSGLHLLDLVDDLLDLGRIEAGKLRVELQPVDLRQLIDYCMDTVRALTDDDRKLRASFDFGDVGDEAPKIQADERLLRQILLNLLSNSVKYTRDGGHIDVQVNRAADGMVEFVVSDDGIGIPEDELARIFELYSRVRDAEVRAEGFGLGLPLVKKMVDLHGGVIEIDSRVNKGTKVSVRLPGGDAVAA